MVLEERITLLNRLGHYFLDNNDEWKGIVEKAERQNGWFTSEFIQLASKNIANQFLQKDLLEKWVRQYPSLQKNGKYIPEVGLIMAGNIPLVGFHDFLCVFISGCRIKIKLSSKDTVLWEHILNLLCKWDNRFDDYYCIAEQLKNCDAYIATGSNNTARYFNYYFQKYPHIIRANRTSVAVLSGNESRKELEDLSDDVSSYFGLGCRNVTQILIPEAYDFKPLLRALDTHKDHFDHNKYRNNYDFQLALMLMNKIKYMSSKAVLLLESESAFSPISVLHYHYYNDSADLYKSLSDREDLQSIIGNSTYFDNPLDLINFGASQIPKLNDFADGVNTMNFLASLK